MNIIKPLIVLTCASAVAHAQHFHSDFDEADLASIVGLNVDTPNIDLGTGDSGTVTLNDVNDQLDLDANGANMWTNREGAPIAWVDSPTVAVGETWYVETQINMVNNPAGVASGYQQSGIVFYGGPDGANPGASDAFVLFLNNWNNWAVQQVALTVGGGSNQSNASIDSGSSNIFLRVEITEGGATDTYNFFYKENVGDAWSQMPGIAEDRMGSFDNSRVGLTLKCHNDNTTGASQFDYLTVDVIPENTWVTDGSGNWSTPANWGVAVPNAQSAEAIFRDSLPYTGPVTASLDAAATIGNLGLESAEAVTIDGANALTFDGGGTATVSATGGSHLISAPVSLTDPLDVSLASGSALELSGALTGTTSVTNSGGGQLTLSGDLSAHTGSIVSDAGSLVVSGTGASDITVNAGSVAVSGATVSNIAVNAGTAELTGTVGGDVTIATGVTLSGEGSNTGALNLAADSALSVDPTNGATAFTTGTLSPTETVSIEFSSSPIGLTDFTVLNYTSYAGTVATDFVSPYRLTLTDTGSSITGTVAPSETSNWTAATDDGGFFFWNNGVSANWDSNDTLFYSGDSVTFTDVGAGFVDVAAEVAPATVTFTNTVGNNYVVAGVLATESISAETGGINVTGAGNVDLNVKITGNTNITHSGTGTLTIGSGVNNDFVGNVAVNGGGSLVIGSNNFLGNTSNTVTIGSGSTFDLNGVNNLQSYDAASFVFEDGATLTNSGGTLNAAFSDQLVFDGDVTLDGAGRFDIHDIITVTDSNIVITLENDVGNVVLGDNSAQSIAEWVVNDGQLIASNNDALGSAIVTVNPEGALRANAATGTIRMVANDVTLNGGQIEVGYQDSIGHYTGTITVAADSIIVPNDDDNDNRELHLTGTLTGSSNVALGSGRTVFASSLNTAGFTGDIILEKNNPSRALQFELEDGINVTQDIIVADVGNFKNIIVAAGNSAEISGNITVNDSNAEDFDFDVQDAADTLTVSGNISGTGAAGVTKTSAGNLILSGINTYTGNSRIYNGTVTLAAGGSQSFYPTANGTTNQVNITGGTLNANGEIYFDLSGADTTAGNVWPIIIGGGTVIPGPTMTMNSSLGAFTNNMDGTLSLDDGSNVWVFNLLDGTLSLPIDDGPTNEEISSKEFVDNYSFNGTGTGSDFSFSAFDGSTYEIFRTTDLAGDPIVWTSVYGPIDQVGDATLNPMNVDPSAGPEAFYILEITETVAP